MEASEEHHEFTDHEKLDPGGDVPTTLVIKLSGGKKETDEVLYRGDERAILVRARCVDVQFPGDKRIQVMDVVAMWDKGAANGYEFPGQAALFDGNGEEIVDAEVVEDSHQIEAPAEAEVVSEEAEGEDAEPEEESPGDPPEAEDNEPKGEGPITWD